MSLEFVKVQQDTNSFKYTCPVYYSNAIDALAHDVDETTNRNSFSYSHIAEEIKIFDKTPSFS